MILPTAGTPLSPQGRRWGGSLQQLCCAGALTSSVTSFLNSSSPSFVKCYLTSSLDLVGMERDPGQREATRLPREPRANGDISLCVAAATVSLGTQGAGILPKKPGGSLRRLLTINHWWRMLGRECWHGTGWQREPPRQLQLAVPGHTSATSLQPAAAPSSCSALTHCFIMLLLILSLFIHTQIQLHKPQQHHAASSLCPSLPLLTVGTESEHISSPPRLTHF